MVAEALQEARHMLSSDNAGKDASTCNVERSFRIGRNRAGLWVVVETSGASGGIFRSRDAALHYATFETDRRPGAVQFWPEPLDLKV
jgi:hypothetical protein